MVYTLIVVLFAIGVSAFVYVQTRPSPLALSSWHLESAAPEAKGLAVDTGDLVLTWKTTGPAEDIGIALENIQTGTRSSEQIVSAAEQRLTFAKGAYAPVLGTRELDGANRIRAVARTSAGTQNSAEFQLRVGINVVAIPVEEDRALWVTALIGNSSIPNYVYQAKVIVWPKHGNEPVSLGDDMKNPKTVFPLPQFASLDFSTLKVAYFGPDDARIVRAGLISR